MMRPAAVVALLLVLTGSTPLAQRGAAPVRTKASAGQRGTPPVTVQPAPAQTVQAQPASERIVVLEGRSMVLQTPFEIERVSFTDKEIAEVQAVSFHELLINGRKPGTITVFVWAAGGRLANEYELVVTASAPTLGSQLQSLFPGEAIKVTEVGTAVVLSGRATSRAVIERVKQIVAAGNAQKPLIDLMTTDEASPEAVPPLQKDLQTIFPKEDIQVTYSGEALILSGKVSSVAIKDRAEAVAKAASGDKPVVNVLQPSIDATQTSQQVMLQVHFAEVSTSALQQLGASLLKIGDKNIGISQTSPAAGIKLDSKAGGGQPTLSINDFLNLFFFQQKEGIGAVIRALQTNGSFESLAQPNLIAYNNKPASFLAGGEFPIAVNTALTGTTITYKKFGVSLDFLPVIDGDVIHLHVKPEVSFPDFVNGPKLDGQALPLLNTRVAETDVELHDGQSFAIAGLLDNINTEDKAAIPLLSRIPIIGKVFQSRSKSKDRRELLVLITAQLVKPLNPDQLPKLPAIIKK